MILIDGHALRSFGNPVAKPLRDLMADFGPLLFIFRFRAHIPGMGPCEHRIDLLAGKRCLVQRPA